LQRGRERRRRQIEVAERVTWTTVIDDFPPAADTRA
jgi:hypothetical protein